MDCPPETKQHMVNLIKEVREIMCNFPKTKDEKQKKAARLEEIRNEMRDFRRKYPDA
jgi:uncharacterized membrane protein